MHKAFGVVHARRGDELNLLPGQLYFGHQAARVRTLLGSCVALTMWHPVKHIGGMCHYLLPSRRRPVGAPLDGRFGDEAVELMLAQMHHSGTAPGEYEVHLYGGADTMPDRAGVKLNIGERNIEQGWNSIEAHGLQLVAVDVGDHVPRHVHMDMHSGDVSMRRGQPTAKGTQP
ncbi:MAG: chemotaxis protein CheD [Burkholderiaceae bacterium]